MNQAVTNLFFCQQTASRFAPKFGDRKQAAHNGIKKSEDTPHIANPDTVTFGNGRDHVCDVWHPIPKAEKKAEKKAIESGKILA